MYKESRVNIPSNSGYRIPAIFATNDSVVANRALILLHGISTHKDEYLDFYRTLAKKFSDRNIATLRIDFRGHGESAISPDGFTISSQLVDLLHAMSWLEREKGFSTVSLLGTSFGAPPCIFASCICPERIDEVFMVAPVLSYRRTFILPETAWGQEVFENVLERTILGGERVYISDEFYIHDRIVSEMCMIDLESSIERSEKAFKMIHGDKDGMVSYEITKDFAARHNNMILYTFENMEHGFTDLGDEEGNSDATEHNINRMVQIISGAK